MFDYNACKKVKKRIKKQKYFKILHALKDSTNHICFYAAADMLNEQTGHGLGRHL